MAGAREQVLHPHACERLRLLLDQGLERTAELVALGRIDEANFAELAQSLAFAAIPPARGRRPLGRIEGIPAVGELCQMGAARIERDIEMEKRVGLTADRLRHLGQRYNVVPQMRPALQQSADGAPQSTGRVRSE